MCFPKSNRIWVPCQCHIVSKHRLGHVCFDKEVCGRGHQQIKRSWILMALCLRWHTPLRLVWLTRATMPFFLLLSKQLRQCRSLGPYAVPKAIHKPVHVSSVGTWVGLKRLSGLRPLTHFQGWLFCLWGCSRTDPGALTNSRQGKVDGREKINQTGLFAAHNDRDGAVSIRESNLELMFKKSRNDLLQAEISDNQ